MNFIDRRIQQIKKEQRPGIMTHVVAGYPNFEGTRELVLMMAAEGVDFVELQIPFSDPLGDGAVIRRANTAAIDNGFRVRDGFRLVKVLKQEDKIETPLLFMTYFNIVFNYGVEKFCRDAKDAGVRGLIVPDYTDEAEEHDHLRRYAREYDLHLIDFLALDSGAAAMTAVEKRARGFVYCFSRRGVTGAREDLLQELGSHLAGIKERVSCPLGVGFGISSGEQVRQLKGKADIVIVGSAILAAYNQGGVEGARGKVGELVGVGHEA